MFSPQGVEQIFGSPRPDDINGPAIVQVRVQPLEPSSSHVRLVEPRQLGEDELQHVHPLGIAKAGRLSLSPSSHLGGIYAEGVGESALRPEVVGQRGHLRGCGDRHRLMIAQWYLLRYHGPQGRFGGV